MKMSCNGCRVLRKGCSEFCVFRPCLDSISTTEAQVNAIIFLSKFYGRTGLTNLISRAPENLRPGIFRSLLYDACGRIVNPIYGSVGLLLSGNWAECQAGVDCILRGSFPAFTRGNFVSHEREIMVPMEGKAGREVQRSMKRRGSGRFKSLSSSKTKLKERQCVPICNDYDSSSKSEEGVDVKKIVDKLGKDKFNGDYVETYSMFLSEQDEFHSVQPGMECCHDLIGTLESNQAETTGCNAVRLELTLGSQSSTYPPTPHKVAAVELSWSETHWDHCMPET